ncbi:cupin domain-containing protein [Candidatus Woesearchaeota archaeon]|nr:cupin domain-containing protein [Candidatus Woesearchaeota archaeon]
MASQKLIDVYELPAVDNVCNQILREVISLPKISVAHVTMNQGNASLWHQHSRMSEIYFVLDGEGILYYGDKSIRAKSGAYLMLPPKTAHKLRNTGNCDLEHLVFAIPPFDPTDVEFLNDFANEKFVPEEFYYDKPPITALDGALIYGLVPLEERNKLGVALAVGVLPGGRMAIPHYHRISEEIYYVSSGIGRIRVGDENFDVKKGSVVYVPKDKVHALENRSESEELKVLCLTSPAYTEGDFIFE